jgi:hypothetical protein
VLAETEAPIFVLQLLLPTFTEAGLEEHQVSGMPVMALPCESITLGVICVDVPFCTTTGPVVEPFAVSVMLATGHEVNSSGMLLTFAALAKIEVRPGVAAVTLACPARRPLIELVTVAVVIVATFAFSDCQVNVPTVSVMSTPRLKAVA